MGCCLCLLEKALNPEKITERINKFFAGMLARKININQIVEDLKSGNILSSTSNQLETLKTFLHDKITNIDFAKTSEGVINTALDDAEKNYGDKTLPFLAILFLCDSNADTFLTAIKAMNSIRHSKNAGESISNTVETGKSGGLFSGIAHGLSVAKNLIDDVKHASNPGMMKKEELKKIVSYYINFITLLPVEILENCHEGGNVEKYVTTVLTNAFGKDVQSNYVEQMFYNNNAQDSIDLDEWFKEHLEVLKDDKGIRLGLVGSYLRTLEPGDIKTLLGVGTLCC